MLYTCSALCIRILVHMLCSTVFVSHVRVYTCVCVCVSVCVCVCGGGRVRVHNATYVLQACSVAPQRVLRQRAICVTTATYHGPKYYTTSDRLGPRNGFESVMKGDHDVMKPHEGRPRCFDTMVQLIIVPQIGLAQEMDLKTL